MRSSRHVCTLGLVELLFAHAVGRRRFGQRVSRREALGMALAVAGVALLLAGH